MITNIFIFENEVSAWQNNASLNRKEGKMANEYALMCLIQDRENVSDSELYKFFKAVNIQPTGGWFHSKGVFSWRKEPASNIRSETFQRVRKCTIEEFFKKEKQKLESPIPAVNRGIPIKQIEHVDNQTIVNNKIIETPEKQIDTNAEIEHVDNQTIVNDKIKETSEKQIDTNAEIPIKHVDFIQLAKDLGIGDPDDLVALERLEKDPMLSAENLTTLINQTPVDEKMVMLNTLVAIGKELGKAGRESERYIKRKKINNRTRLSHAFAISEKGIFIVPKKAALDDTGSLKVISHAIKLENNNHFIRAKITQHTEGRDRIEAAKNEYNLLTSLHSLGEKEETCCLVPAHECCMLSENGKGTLSLIMFQVKLNGNGFEMLEARAKHQLQVYKDIATGLAVLHKLGYVHMDVKPDNFLIEGSVRGNGPVRGKLCDFDLSCPIGTETEGGDIAYLAPEIFSKMRPANPKMDSFSLGLMIYLAMCPWGSSLPRCIKSDDQLKEAIQKAKEIVAESTKPTKEEKRIRSAMLDVAQKLMVVSDPNKRISCQEAVSELNKI